MYSVCFFHNNYGLFYVQRTVRKCWKRLTSGEGSFSVQGTALPSHLRKLVFSAYTNIPPSTSPHHPIMGLWLGEPGTGITVGGPRERVHSPWLLKLENTQAGAFQVRSKEHWLSQGHGKLGHLPAGQSGSPCGLPGFTAPAREGGPEVCVRRTARRAHAVLQQPEGSQNSWKCSRVTSCTYCLRRKDTSTGVRMRTQEFSRGLLKHIKLATAT